MKFISNPPAPWDRLAEVVDGEDGTIVNSFEHDGNLYYNILFPTYGAEAVSVPEDVVE